MQRSGQVGLATLGLTRTVHPLELRARGVGALGRYRFPRTQGLLGQPAASGLQGCAVNSARDPGGESFPVRFEARFG